jgi:glyoxylase-like metal-dependent hydrolase (beta-lactamase superfamily II)
MIDEVRAFEGGYCRQLLALVDRKSWRLERFQAVFLALRHRREGWILIDTGYGTQFRDATRSFPHRIYRLATPVTHAGSTAGILAGAGIPATDIRHVLITHFHPDHVGGLAEFPHATVHYHQEALESFGRLSVWRQVRAAFLSRLVPGWLPDRAIPIPASAFSASDTLPFDSHDLFGDGSLQLVHLPGHAPGQVGALFRGRTCSELYATDAYWRGCQITDEIEPSSIAMSLQWDADLYRRTVRTLREVSRQGRHRLTACHDRGAGSRLNGGAGEA